MKIYHHPTLADSICNLRTRKIKKAFFTELNRLLDWEKISKIIDGHYIIRGKVRRGSPSDDGLFRLLSTSTRLSNHLSKYYSRCVYYKPGMDYAIMKRKIG